MTQREIMEAMRSVTQAAKPMKSFTIKDNGIHFTGVIANIYMGTPSTKTSAAQSELRGGKGGSAGPSYTRSNIVFIPTNVHSLIQEWIDLPASEREKLPYVPLFGRCIPTIALRFSSNRFDKVTKESTTFELPIDRPEFWIEQFVAKSASTFNAVTMQAGEGMVQIVSYSFAPTMTEIPSKKFIDSPNGKLAAPETLEEAEPDDHRSFKCRLENNKNYEVKFYSSCTDIVPFKSELDGLPREYLSEALFWSPVFEEFNLNAIIQSHSGQNGDEFKPYLHWLSLVRPPRSIDAMEACYEACLRYPKEITDGTDLTIKALRPAGYILNPNESHQASAGMMYSTLFFKGKEGNRDGHYPETDPQAFVMTDKRAGGGEVEKNYAGSQITFVQWSETFNGVREPALVDTNQVSAITVGKLSGYKGAIKLRLYEDAVDHCGINHMWPMLMARLPIKVSVLAKTIPPNTVALEENKKPAMRQDTPLGIFEARQQYTAWHVIDQVRTYGIPVTADWIRKTLAHKERRLKFKPPVGKKMPPNLANDKKGAHYGYVNLTEYSLDDKDDYLDPTNNWLFGVLVDFDYSDLSPEDRIVFHSLTPDDGCLVMDSKPLANKQLLHIRSRSNEGGVIIAYKYDPKWLQLVKKQRDERTLTIVAWRQCLSDKTTLGRLDEASKFYISSCKASDKIVKSIPTTTEATSPAKAGTGLFKGYDGTLVGKDRLSAKAIQIFKYAGATTTVAGTATTTVTPSTPNTPPMVQNTQLDQPSPHNSPSPPGTQSQAMDLSILPSDGEENADGEYQQGQQEEMEEGGEEEEAEEDGSEDNVKFHETQPKLKVKSPQITGKRIGDPLVQPQTKKSRGNST